MVLGFAQQSISLQDIWKNYVFYPKSAGEFRWMKDDRYYTVLQTENGKSFLMKYSVLGDTKPDTLVRPGAFALNGVQLTVSDYEFSDDESKLILKTEITPIYRRSWKAKTYIYSFRDNRVFPIHAEEPVSYPTFSPKADKIAYTAHNNLYVTDLTTLAETAITVDGKENQVINGSTDWVYEEEFSFAQAFYWSSDGNSIAHYRFDESEVPEFSMTLYGSL
ncbi:MAG: DPP IV N-terminal domain-containing protein, partial [Bacteroidia bacterium]|nr:DPP IV N-terminal domain-containing protein [Bacteroidia bacterium]